MTVFWILIVLLSNDGPRAPVFQTFQTEAACEAAAEKINAKNHHYTAFCVQDGPSTDSGQASQ